MRDWMGRAAVAAGMVAAAGACAHRAPVQAPAPAVQPARLPVASRPPPTGERRHALVIGNAAYTSGLPPLRNPEHDAEAIADRLQALGFDVLRLKNARREQMVAALGEFGAALQDGGVGLFFYAGHGVQVDGSNYMVPVDAHIASEQDIRDTGIPLDAVLARMAEAGNRFNLVFLDACRNNPFSGRQRGVKKGLALLAAPQGTMVAFATAPDDTADDGDGSNGVFTTALLHNLGTPGRPIEDTLKSVTAEVERTTNGKQVPWRSTNYTGDFTFAPCPDQLRFDGRECVAACPTDTRWNGATCQAELASKACPTGYVHSKAGCLPHMLDKCEDGSPAHPRNGCEYGEYSVRELARDGQEYSHEYGMIGLLNAGAGSDSDAPTAPWDTDVARGNMWGDEIGDAFGAAGLGLSGIGEGGGGAGEGIGLGSLGSLGRTVEEVPGIEVADVITYGVTAADVQAAALRVRAELDACYTAQGSGNEETFFAVLQVDPTGHVRRAQVSGASRGLGGCVQGVLGKLDLEGNVPEAASSGVTLTLHAGKVERFSSSGFGQGHGRLGGSHRTAAPRVRMGEVTVTGRLPPEVVQRIVRQNYGRFRMCYEQGLARQPQLAGRVTVRFVIDPEGLPTSVADAGSDLPDAGVISCVVRAYYGLAFPQPEGGVVSVVYPIMFSPPEESGQ